MATLAGFRRYAVIGDEESDQELTPLLEAAMAYAEGAGVPEPEEDNSLYDLVVYRIATFYHDHKAFPDVARDADLIGVNGMLLQLRAGVG